MPDRADALIVVGAIGSVRDVGVIAEAFGRPDHWGDAVRALEAVLSRARARDLIWLEANARAALGSYRYYGSPWQALAPEQVEKLPGAAQRLATFHANGRVREAAVRVLASTDDADVLAYLVLRVNDWVVQVSDAARHALSRRLHPGDAAAWITVLPFEGHVRALKRRPLAHLFDVARHLLVQPEARAAVREALAAEPPETRRACADLAAGFPDDERTAALMVAVQDSDPIVASRAARGLLAREGRREIARTLLAHRVAAVRVLALNELAARAPAEAIDPLRAGLFDPARRVREVAQFELPRRCGVAPLPIYVAALPHAAGPKLVPTIAGLAECGGAGEATLVAPFLRAPSVRVRFEALRAVSRLDGDTYASAFLDALEDASPRVQRAAREALSRRAHLIDRARLDALLGVGGRSTREALLLLPQVDYWGALLAALRAAPGPELKAVAVKVLGRLVRRQTYSLPPDHEALERAFGAVRSELPMAKRLEDLLKLVRPR